jgi:hypothetical protein
MLGVRCEAMILDCYVSRPFTPQLSPVEGLGGAGMHGRGLSIPNASLTSMAPDSPLLAAHLLDQDPQGAAEAGHIMEVLLDDGLHQGPGLHAIATEHDDACVIFLVRSRTRRWARCPEIRQLLNCDLKISV